MSRSAKGTIENPGRNVKAKAGVNKAILDQRWGELKRQLGYKQSWRGGLLVVVPPQHYEPEMLGVRICRLGQPPIASSVSMSGLRAY